MDEVNSEFEVFGIPVRISLSFKDLDLVIDTLNLSSGDAVIEVVEQPVQMPDQFIGEPCKQVDTAGPGCRQPVAEEGPCFLHVTAPPEQPQFLFEDIGGADRLVDGRQFIESLPGIPVIGDLLGTFQEQIPDSFEDSFVFLPGFGSLRCPDEIECFVVVGHDVVAIKDDHIPAKVETHCLDITRPHIHGDSLDLRPGARLSFFRNGSRASVLRPSATHTTSPVSRSTTTVR